MVIFLPPLVSLRSIGDMQSILTLSGLQADDFALVSVSRFLHLLRTRGILVASSSTAVRLTMKVMWLMWKIFAPYVMIRQLLVVLFLQFFS